MTKTPVAHYLGFTLALAFTLAASVLVLTTLSTPAHADILVLRDGSTLETEGPWEVRGAIIVFTLPSGALSSLRTSKVDIDASARATIRANEPPKAVAEPVQPKQAAFVLTDRDVAHVSPYQAAPPEAEVNDTPAEDQAVADQPAADDAVEETPTDDGFEDDQADPAGDIGSIALSSSAPPTAVPEVDRLQVTSWEQSASTSSLGGTRILGTLVNSSQEIASQIQVTVRLVDDSGSMIASTEAAVTAAALRPQQSTSFRADIPGVVGFEQVQFETQHVALAWRPAARN